MPVKVHPRSVESLPAHDSNSIASRFSSWKLTSRAVDSFMADTRTSNLLVLCSEPGLGQSAELKRLLSGLKHHYATHLFRFSGMEPSSASKRLSRFARQVEKECLAGKHVIVALDKLPAGDELVVDREVACISRMISSGALVAISLLPEDALVM